MYVFVMAATPEGVRCVINTDSGIIVVICALTLS